MMGVILATIFLVTCTLVYVIKRHYGVRLSIYTSASTGKVPSPPGS